MKKRADGLYQKQITIIEKGVKTQKCFYGKTIAAVNKKIIEYTGQAERGRLFSEVANEWWEEHQKTLASNSLKSLAPAVRRAKDEFGSAPIKEISARDINRFITVFASEKRAQKTVTTQLQAVRQVLAYGVLNGELEYNHALSVKIPKNLPKGQRNPPSEDDVAKIKATPAAPFALFALFALYTGCRKGELLALQYRDIDFENMQINITKSVYHVGDKPFIKEPKTEAGKRKVALLEPLKAAIPKMKSDEYVFNDNGKLITNRRFITQWNSYCKAVGVTITPHQLRHAYATRLYELGIDEKSAQDLLGHADINTTRNIYTHISEQKRKSTAKQLQNF